MCQRFDSRTAYRNAGTGRLIAREIGTWLHRFHQEMGASGPENEEYVEFRIPQDDTVNWSRFWERMLIPTIYP